jgi:hypothetical protein
MKPHLLKSPDGEVKVRGVTAAPTLVAVEVVGVMARAGIGHLDHHAATLAHTIAVDVGAIAIPHVTIGALNLVASAAAASVLGMCVSKGCNVPAGALVGPKVTEATACMTDEAQSENCYLGLYCDNNLILTQGSCTKMH